MPMDFPDLKSIINAGSIHGFRSINKMETEDEYRESLANFVSDIDLIESLEIRNKVGWDKFSKSQNVDMLIRSGLKARKHPARRRGK